MSISRFINLNDSYPPAPEGARNGKWQSDEHDPKNASVYFDARGLAGITIDGGGSPPTTGSKGYLRIPFAATIKSWTLLANVSGNAVITVKKSTYAGFPTTASIVASAAPTLATEQKSTDATLTGWTTAIAAGDVLEFVVTSISTITRLHLFLELLKT